MSLRQSKTAFFVLLSAVYGCAGPNEEEISTMKQEYRTCDPINTDSCCPGHADSCNIYYGEQVSDFLKYPAMSNGDCTGGPSGEFQCAKFAKDFLTCGLHHQRDCDKNKKEDCTTTCGGTKVATLFTRSWTPLKSGTYVNDALNAENKPTAADPIFVFDKNNSGWTSTQEPPRESDVLVFTNGGAGHFVVAMGAIPKTDGSIHVPIIEENVAMTSGNGPGGICHHRVLIGTKDASGKWVIVSGIGDAYKYAGFIRHNLAGIYGDTGWHDDGTSQAFRDKYLEYGTKLGWAFSDHDGTPFVHRVRNVWVQNFRQTDPNDHFGTDGETMLALWPEVGVSDTPKAHLIKEGFFGAIKCIPGSDGKPMGGLEYLGAPLSEEVHGRFDGNCNESTDESLLPVWYQRFHHGCLWWRDAVDGKVHIHLKNGTQVNGAAAAACGVQVENNPPGADCTDDCVPGTQQCADSSRLNICGHPGPDACYHWIPVSCASGLVCRSGICEDAASVTGSGGAASSTGGATSSAGGTSAIAQLCSPRGATRCVTGNPSMQEACILDTSTGITNWMLLPCPWNTVCTGAGECREVPSTGMGGMSSSGGMPSAVTSTGGRPPSTGGMPAVTGGSPSTGGMATVSGGVPMATGGSPTAPASTALRLVYTSPICGSLRVEAWWTNIDSTNRAWAAVTECVDANPADCTLDCILPIPSGTPYFEFQAYAPNNQGYGNEDCYNGGCGKPLGELHLYKGSSEIPFMLIPNPAGAPYYNEVLQPVP